MSEHSAGGRADGRVKIEPPARVRYGIRGVIRNVVEITSPCTTAAISRSHFSVDSKHCINSRLPLNMTRISATPLHRPFPTAMVISRRNYSKKPTRHERNQDSDSDSDLDSDDENQRR